MSKILYILNENANLFGLIFAVAFVLFVFAGLFAITNENASINFEPASSIEVKISIPSTDEKIEETNEFKAYFKAYDNGDYRKAFEILKPLAEAGNAVAQNNLGAMYYNGHGVPESYQEAIRWFSKSAEQGNANAQNHLGEMYWLGRGVLENMELAATWFLIAKANGSKEATENLEIISKTADGIRLKAQQNAAKMVEETPLLLQSDIVR